MRILEAGLHGQDVLDAECALAQADFYSGDIDGDFGPGMAAAVKAFQHSKGLPQTGIIDSNTATSLGLRDLAPCDCSLSAIPAGIIQAQLFPGTPVANLECNLPYLLNALVKRDLGYRVMILAALATMRAEAATFLPVSEGVSSLNTSPGGQPFDLYASKLGNEGVADAQKFRGRGFIQLTGRCNYAAYSTADYNLVENPLLLHRPDVAADVLAHFLKDRETQMVAYLTANNMDEARKLVNAGDVGVGSFTWAYTQGSGLACMEQVPTSLVV